MAFMETYAHVNSQSYKTMLWYIAHNFKATTNTKPAHEPVVIHLEGQSCVIFIIFLGRSVGIIVIIGPSVAGYADRNA